MSQDFGTPSPEYKSLSWSEVWINALTRPAVETYERIVHDPRASSNRAYGWVFISALIGYVLSIPIGLVMAGLFDGSSIAGLNTGVIGSPIIQLICAPFAAILAVVGLVINAGLTQLIARALGGTGTYSELVYAYAAYTAPLSLITSILFAIPIVNICLGIPLTIYTIVLAVIAINAINKFGWGKAIASAIIIPLAIIVFVACMVIAVLALLGPAIGNVFSDIARELSTPAQGAPP
jgi:MFS family permease